MAASVQELRPKSEKERFAEAKKEKREKKAAAQEVDKLHSVAKLEETDRLNFLLHSEAIARLRVEVENAALKHGQAQMQLGETQKAAQEVLRGIHAKYAISDTGGFHPQSGAITRVIHNPPKPEPVAPEKKD